MAAVALLMFAIGVAVLWAAYNRNSAGSLAGITRIAVFPIRAQGNVEESIRFGLTDSLTARLHGLGVFAVRPASSMLAYDHDLRDPITIGRQLGLDAILDGRVQDEDGRIRVNLQLVNIRTGENIWTGQFDGRPEMLLDLHEAIFRKLIADTGLSLVAADKVLASRPPTQNIEAYKAYHRGRVLFSDLIGHRDNWDNAVKEFETALALDPNFSLALTGLADVYSRKANAPSFNARDEYYTRAREFARRAVEADPDMPEAHISYAWIKRNYEWDFEGSEAHFRKALELSPSHPEAHRQYSFLLSTLGRHSEAVDHARKAVELDPSQMNHIRSYGLILVLARQYSEALRQFDHFFSLDPKNTNELRYVFWALYSLGRDNELIERFENLPEKDRTHFQTRTYYALAYRRARSTAAGDKMIGELARESTGRSDKRVRFATTLATLGRFSEALDILEEGLRIKEDRMLWVKAQPEFEALRGEPRYQAILREMKLAD
jgi:tetratricopeptide (TPR) repeat protein